MTRPSDSHLQENAELLKRTDQMCQEIMDTITGDPYDLNLSDYFYKASMATLERLSYAFSHRATQIEEQLEARRNEKMDNFRNRKIT